MHTRCGSLEVISGCVHAPSLRCVRHFATPWTVAPPGSSVHGISQASMLEQGCHLLLQGILPTQGSNTHLLHWQTDPLPLSYQGSPSLGPASYIRFPNNSVLFQDPKVTSFQSQGWGEVTKVRLLRTRRCSRIYLGAAPFDLKACEAETSHLPFGCKHTTVRQA